jgi:hypothetical protein
MIVFQKLKLRHQRQARDTTLAIAEVRVERKNSTD